MDSQYIKRIVDNKQLARHFLGNPAYEKGNSLWYYSPLRAKERTPSFIVNDKGFRDFGTGKSYDCFSFIQAYMNVDFNKSMQIVSNLYGIQENEYDNARIRHYLQKQREENLKYEKSVKERFIKLMDITKQASDENDELLSIKGLSAEAKSILYSRQIFLGQLWEEIQATDSFHEKEKLLEQITKEKLPKWMESKNYIMGLMNINTMLNQKREY